MSEQFTYQEYVTDDSFLEEYNEYQGKYAKSIRESDKEIIRHVKSIVENRSGKKLRILDIGCSTGNLLLHLKHQVPAADYVGGDLALSSLEECRQNPKLSGIEFAEMDIVNLPTDSFDIIIVNAVLYMFGEQEYERALTSLQGALRENGKVIMYDFAHPFAHQNLTIYETSLLHPNGLRLCFRPMPLIRDTAADVGFSETEFHPFELPIDLAQPGYEEEVVTYTRTTATDERLMFRGVLFQPWCHIVMSK